MMKEKKSFTLHQNINDRPDDTSFIKKNKIKHFESQGISIEVKLSFSEQTIQSPHIASKSLCWVIL